MAHYLFAVYTDDQRTPMTQERQQQAWDDTGTFNDRLRELGALVYANGLAQEARVFDNSGASPVERDGFYIEGPKRLGGFWIIDAPDEHTAHAWAREASTACNEPVEVRAFH